MIVAFTHLALSQGRNVALWSVVIGPLLALYVQDALGTSQNRRRLAGGIKSVANVLLLAMVLLVYAGEGHHFVSAKTLRQAESQSYPSGAVAYMRTHPLPSHVLAAYDWGGYLLWNLFPRYRDYMDSRADTLFNAAILHGYLDMLEAKPDWKRMLKRYGVQTVLVQRTAPLAQVLAEHPAWHLVYHDSVAVLYVRA
jgi:hypothetical protein